jgi:hypothetical protein
MWGVIGCTALMVIDLIWVRVLLATIAVSVTIHLLRRKTLDAKRRIPSDFPSGLLWVILQ